MLELGAASDLLCLLNSHGKVQVVTVHTLKAYRGSRGKPPLILNLHCYATHILNLTLAALPPGKNPPPPIECRSGWDPVLG